MKDLNVLFMGSPSFSVPVLEELNKNVNIVVELNAKQKNMNETNI